MQILAGWIPELWKHFTQNIETGRTFWNFLTTPGRCLPWNLSKNVAVFTPQFGCHYFRKITVSDFTILPSSYRKKNIGCKRYLETKLAFDSVSDRGPWHSNINRRNENVRCPRFCSALKLTGSPIDSRSKEKQEWDKEGDGWRRVDRAVS